MNQLERAEALDIVRRKSADCNLESWLISYIRGRFQTSTALAKEIVHEALNIKPDEV